MPKRNPAKRQRRLQHPAVIVCLTLLIANIARIDLSGAMAGSTSPTMHRQGQLAGPVAARVLRVIDGDTVAVRANIWPGQHIDVSVRLAGIDAPELRSRCQHARRHARLARLALINLIAGKTVFLHDVRRGKYAGRVIARLRTSSGIDVADVLLDRGLARVSGYRRLARMRRSRWCPQGTVVALDR